MSEESESKEINPYHGLLDHQRVAMALLDILIDPFSANSVVSLMDVDAAQNYVASAAKALIRAVDNLRTRLELSQDAISDAHKAIQALDQQIQTERADADQKLKDAGQMYQDSLELRNERTKTLQDTVESYENEVKALTQDLAARTETMHKEWNVIEPLFHHPEIAQLILGDRFEEFVNAVKLSHKIETIKILREITGVGLVDTKILAEALMQEGIYTAYKVPGPKRKIKQHPEHTWAKWVKARKAGETSLGYKDWVHTLDPNFVF